MVINNYFVIYATQRDVEDNKLDCRSGHCYKISTFIGFSRFDTFYLHLAYWRQV
jgi:hypothetical protein